jgi:hypothetical protein
MGSASNIEILECFQSKVLRTIVDAPWYVLNTVIRKDLQTPRVKEQNPSLQLSIHCVLQFTPKRPSTELCGATRQQAIAKALAKQSAYLILSVIVLFVV